MASCMLWMLSVSLVLLAGLLTHLLPQHGPPLVNYDATVYFSHAHLRTPSSKEDIVDIVKTAAEKGQKVRVLGSGHSWSSVAVSDEVLVSLWNYTGLVSVDRQAMEVTVRAGTTLKWLNRFLESEGLAMKNLGSILDQTAAGAVSTGTHGNGLGFGNMATLVTRLEFVNGKGEIVSVTADSNPDVFKAAQVSIGMLGIFTEVTFQIEPSFYLRETLTTHTLSHCLENFDGIMRSGEHAKLWLDLFSSTCSVFASNKTAEDGPRDNPNWFAKNFQIYQFELVLYVTSWFPSSVPHVMRFIFNYLSPFPPYDRVAISYNVLNVPHILPVHWEAEVVVPFEKCPEAIRELKRVVFEHEIPANLATEIRSVKGDDIWLSPDYLQDSCHITVTLYNPSFETTDRYFRELFTAVSRQLGVAPRLHWGKYMSGVGVREVENMYPRLPDFARIRRQMDPHNLFMNHALREIFEFF